MIVELDLRKQFVLEEIRCEKHALRMFDGIYDDVAGRITPEERGWAEAVIESDERAAEELRKFEQGFAYLRQNP